MPLGSGGPCGCVFKVAIPAVSDRHIDRMHFCVGAVAGIPCCSGRHDSSISFSVASGGRAVRLFQYASMPLGGGGSCSSVFKVAILAVVVNSAGSSKAAAVLGKSLLGTPSNGGADGQSA
jgi:hypothetical protein